MPSESTCADRCRLLERQITRSSSFNPGLSCTAEPARGRLELQLDQQAVTINFSIRTNSYSNRVTSDLPAEGQTTVSQTEAPARAYLNTAQASPSTGLMDGMSAALVSSHLA